MKRAKTILTSTIGILVIAFIITSPGCKKDSDKSAAPGYTSPIVSTDSIRYNHFTSADCMADLKDSGASAVLQTGFVWSKTHNPVVGGQGAGVVYLPYQGYGAFFGTITPLDYASIYYIRAFATNKNGIGYGAEKTIQTSEEARTFYVGTWAVAETGTKLAYIVKITKDAGTNTDILLYNFANVNDTIIPARAHVSGPDVTLPTDLSIGNGYVVNGSGSVSVNDKILWNYSLNDGNNLLYLVASYARVAR